MLYRGTPSYPSPHALAYAFEQLGGTLEAATYVDHGVLELDLPVESVAQALPVFCEVFSEPILQGIEIERGIVREEILETLDDDGKLIDADELGHQLAFGDHPLGRPITGGLGELERFDEAILRAHHREFYTSGSSVFCIAGPTHGDKLIPVMERAFSNLATGTLPKFTAPDAQTEARFHFVAHVSSQTDLRVMFRTPGSHDRIEPALELLLRVLDDGMSTRLYQHICNNLGLCYDVSAYYESWEDCGTVEIAASSAHQRAPELLVELLRLVERLRDDGPSTAELELAKRRHSWQLQQMIDDPAEIAQFYGLAHLMKLAPTIDDRFAEVQQVSLEDVRHAAATVFSPGSLNVIAVGQQPKRSREKMQRAVADFR